MLRNLKCRKLMLLKMLLRMKARRHNSKKLSTDLRLKVEHL